MKKRKNNRKSRALAAANRKAYLVLGIGLAAGAAVWVIVLQTVPTVTPEQMTELLKRQSVRTAPGSTPAPKGNALPAAPVGTVASTGTGKAPESDTERKQAY